MMTQNANQNANQIVYINKSKIICNKNIKFKLNGIQHIIVSYQQQVDIANMKKNQEEELESDDYMNGFYIYKNINNFFTKIGKENYYTKTEDFTKFYRDWLHENCGFYYDGLRPKNIKAIDAIFEDWCDAVYFNLTGNFRDEEEEEEVYKIDEVGGIYYDRDVEEEETIKKQKNYLDIIPENIKTKIYKNYFTDNVLKEFEKNFGITSKFYPRYENQPFNYIKIKSFSKFIL